MVEIRPTVEDYDRLPPTDFSSIEGFAQFARAKDCHTFISEFRFGDADAIYVAPAAPPHGLSRHRGH